MEKAAAKRVGGRQTASSGNKWYDKGDVRLKGVTRIECKTTKHASFSVTLEMIDKIEAAVAGAGEVPVIEIELALGQAKVFVVPAWAMDSLLEKQKEK